MKQNRIVGFITGVISGLLSALFGAGGPVEVIYFSYGLRGKERVRATLLFYFLLLQIWVFITYVYAGLISLEVLGFSALIFPSSIIGMISGSKLQGYLSEAAFRKAVAITLFITGVFLIVL
ncbi:MAG: sulfite exporter TauE/SafE family protein [Desulfobacterales bacterium]|nr:sulfite exporter TauE/SafE family protein [Desulfobacterales bacterium]